MQAQFSVGQTVCLKADPTRQGPVHGILSPLAGRIRYRVFLPSPGEIHEYSEEQLFEEQLLSVSVIMSNEDRLLRRHHELFAEDDEPFTDDWAYDYFEKYRDRLNIYYSGQTDSGNYSSGDEAENIYSQMYKDEVFYWVETSTGGPRGPFAELDEAISALGYDPKTFKMP